MNKTIWDTLIEAGNAGDKAEIMVPYVTNGQNNHYKLYSDSSRPTRQCEHALNHCFAMASYCCEIDQYPLSCDWVISAAALTDTESEFLPRLFDIWASFNNSSTWPELLRSPPEQFGKRLLGLTIIRIFIVTNIEFSPEHNTRLIAFARSACADVFDRLKITEKQKFFEQVSALKSLDKLIQELFQPLVDAASATDIRFVLQRTNPIQRALNDGLTKGITSPHLPPSFLKTTIPAVFDALQALISCNDSRFIEHVTLARAELSQATKRLKDELSFYAAVYFLPLLENLSCLVEQCFQSSDATKPARLTVEAYPRKYPFHSQYSFTRLRFVVENHGPGPARNIEMHLLLLGDLIPNEPTICIFELGVGRQAVDLEVAIGDVQVSVEFHVRTVWQNMDSTEAESEVEGVLECQKLDVDWDKLILRDPYSIEAIALNSERPFVGREADVQQLLRTMAGKAIGSAYIYGQKRVGKTSLAFEVACRAERVIPHVHPIYLEGGDYVQTSAQGTLQSLGRQIAKRMRKRNRQLERISLPEFTDSLSPLNEFVDDVIDVLPEAKFLLLLDEFDELPLDLYKRGPMGDAFFLTLRALSGRPQIGIILIGGEKIGQIISTQGDQLNRFESLRVDYFRRDEHWADFQSLVREPVIDSIEFSGGAIESVYRWSAGNPFFTNMICKEVLQRCCDRRDAFVSELEVEECASLACSKAGAPSFQHFWEDGVLKTGSETEDVSIRRRRLLLAIAAALRAGKTVSRDVLAEQRDLTGMSPSALDSELKRFVERGVLVETQGKYSCRVFMFERFLVERSAELISTEFTDRDERIMQEQEENAAYVQATEICRLVQKWGAYGPTVVTSEQVRAWLNQFESNKDQRVMFQLLKSLQFFTEAMVREKLKSAMTFIRKETIEKIREGEHKRRDILVSYLGGVAKSGTQYARMFCQENKILLSNAVEWSALEEYLIAQKDDIQALVIIDDFLGTGMTVTESLPTINERIGNLLRESKIKLFLVSICGFDDAITKIQKTATELHLPLEIYCSEILGERDRAFSESSIIFETERDRLRAKQIAEELGEKLEKKWPLGHGNCQAMVVFFSNCPNNTLPIIYKDGTNWTALFPRR